MVTLPQKIYLNYKSSIEQITQTFFNLKLANIEGSRPKKSIYAERIAHRFMSQILSLCCIAQDKEKDHTGSGMARQNLRMGEKILPYFIPLQNDPTQLKFNISRINTDFQQIYSTDASSIIRFLNQKSLTESMEQIPISTNFVDHVITAIWKPMIEAIPDKNESLQSLPEILSNLFEDSGLSGQKSRVKKGVFYTPIDEIRFSCIWTMQAYMNNFTRFYPPPGRFKMFQTIGELFSNSPKWEQIDCQSVKIILKYTGNINVLDPACGSGAFLEPFVRFYSHIFHYLSTPFGGSQSKNIIQAQIQTINILGSDVNPWALELAKFRLKLILHTKGYDSFLNTDLFCCDFLLDRSYLVEKYEAFHIIIGNPPYIRNRDITDPSGGESERSFQYRQEIKKDLKQIPEVTESDTTRIDYYLYFFYQGLNLLSIGGVLGFITSNSWMNVRFGDIFKKYILTNYAPLFFFDNTYRSFQTADINTVISIIGDGRLTNPHRKKRQFQGQENCYFIRLERPFKDFSFAKSNITSLFSEYRTLTTRKGPKFDKDPQISEKSALYRLLRVTPERMFEAEVGEAQKFIGGDKGIPWGNYYFNATPLIFQLNEQIGKTMIHLGNIGKISRGVTTNCNDFFTLKKIDESDFPYENGYGDRVFIEPQILTPFLFSPRQLETKKIDPGQISTYLFYTDLSLEELEANNFSGAVQYIRMGMKKEIYIKKGAKKGQKIKGVHNLKSFQARYRSNPTRWFCLEKRNNRTRETKQIIFQKIYNTTYKLAITPPSLIPNNTFYKLNLKESYRDDIEYIFALLQSSITFISLELEGRTNFGGGALDTATFDIEKIMLLNPSILTAKDRVELLKFADTIINDAYGSLESEFKKPARTGLDNIILRNLDGNCNPDDLYRDVKAIQSKRISKSDTFKKK